VQALRDALQVGDELPIRLRARLVAQPQDVGRMEGGQNFGEVGDLIEALRSSVEAAKERQKSRAASKRAG